LERKKICKEEGIRGFVHLAFAGVFVRHRALQLWLWRLGGGVVKSQSDKDNFLRGLRWDDGPSWRCTSRVNVQPEYRFSLASLAANI
jgi:hypothetical protein